MEAYIRALLGFLSKHDGVCNVQTKKGTGVTEVRAGGPEQTIPERTPPMITKGGGTSTKFD